MPPGPDAYPEMILASAHEEIETLQRERALRAARAARRRSRGGISAWLRRRVVRGARG